MPTNRGFAYIPGGSSIDGCENIGYTEKYIKM